MHHVPDPRELSADESAVVAPSADSFLDPLSTGNRRHCLQEAAMRHTFRSPLALLIFAGALALLAGCDGGPSPTQLMNQPPTVRLTAAPVSELKSDSVFYAYRINWVGYDPDGRVDYFMYAIDPPSVDVVDSTWTRTTLNEQFLFFRAPNRHTNKQTR